MNKDNIEIWFTSRNIYDKDYDELDWEDYIKWSKLSQLEELVSLDGMLNDLVFTPNLETEIEEVVTIGNQITTFFKSINYVKEKSNHLDYFNLLAVIREPNKNKQVQLERDFDFIGYDLIEKNGNISALTNCGGFDETFKPKELNHYGLISDYDRVKEIQATLPINNPNECHADCFLFEVWRHKFIGRNGSFNESFCTHLAEHLVRFDCDGIDYKKISKKTVNDKRLIKTNAWLIRGKYEMKIHLGKKSLRRFAKGTPMIDCIPSFDTMDWIEVDHKNRTIEIELK